MPEKQRRGRPETDIAIRLQSWGWYWIIRRETQLTDGRLDARYLQIDKDVRPRYFFRVRVMGSSPAALRGSRARRSLYQRVHEKGDYPQAAAWYESLIWIILCDRTLTSTQYTEIVNSVLKKRGLYRATREEAAVGELFLPQSQAMSPQSYEKYPGMVREIAALGLDGVVILSAMYKEALLSGALDIALDIKRQLLPTASLLWRQLGIDARVGQLFEELIKERVIYNNWISEGDIIRHAGRSDGARRNQIDAIVDWYLRGDAESLRWSPVAYPVVLESAHTRWVKKHIKRLEVLKQKLTDSLSLDEIKLERLYQSVNSSLASIPLKVDGVSGDRMQVVQVGGAGIGRSRRGRSVAERTESKLDWG